MELNEVHIMYNKQAIERNMNEQRKFERKEINERIYKDLDLKLAFGFLGLCLLALFMALVYELTTGNQVIHLFN